MTPSLRAAYRVYSRWVMKHIALEERYASFVRRLEAARKRNGLE